MKRYLFFILVFMAILPACLFHHTVQDQRTMLLDPVGDYMGLEEGVVWSYTFMTPSEEEGDLLFMAVVSSQSEDETTTYKIREEWGPYLAEEPLQGYYWAFDEKDASYHEVGRWNQREDFFYHKEDYLFILPKDLSLGDKVFENYTFGDSFTVKGKEKVEVAAGTFEAYLLESLWGDKGGGPWEEDRIFFVPHVGVVKRELVRGYSVDGEVMEEFPYTMELLDYSRLE